MALSKTLLVEANLSLDGVRLFDCGSLPRDRNVANFLRDEALQQMRTDSGLRVWLFWNVDELVGFASLGQTEWSYPRPNGSKKVVVQIIPNLAVSVTHGNRGYGREILQGVIVEALRRRDTVSELLGLLVHVENARAIHIYDTEGFENHGKPSTYDGESFQRMIITLPAAHEVVVS